MKVILQKPVDKLGVPGDIVEVADGYARNYLMPRGMAVKATKGGEQHVNSLKRAHTTRVDQAKAESEQVASRLAATPITVSAHAGAIAKQAGIHIDRHDVHLDEAIRSVGTHEVRVHLFADVDPVISVEVIGTES
jgi:large subunit ribosomal protein L9